MRKTAVSGAMSGSRAENLLLFLLQHAAAAAAASCRSTENHRKLGRRTSIHDLRSPNLPTEQRYMTMHSYVWKWRWGPERSHTSNC